MKTLIAFLISLPLWAQVDFPNPIRSGGTLPATCRPGSLVPALFVLTSGTPVTSAQTYQCTAANTWTAIPTSGGGGGSPAGPTNSVQCNAGGGMFCGTGIDWTGDFVGTTVSNAAGVNDGTYGGTYTDGAANPGATFYSYISMTGTPDKFSWAKCDLVFRNCTMETEVSITGSPQILSDGVTITFGTTTGHHSGDEWDVATGLAEVGNLKLVDSTAFSLAYAQPDNTLGTDSRLSWNPFSGGQLRIASAGTSALQTIIKSLGVTTQFVPLNGTDDLTYYLQGATMDLTATTSGAVPAVNYLVGSFTANGAQVAEMYPITLASPQLLGGATIQKYYGLLMNDLSSIATTGAIALPYYTWLDSRGVLRVKEDNSFNSVGQAIQALYNPQFAKYTAGAVNYERLILGEWNSNVSEIGNYAGGTGTVRALKLLGSQFSFGTASNISTTTFTGAGLNDGALGGTYTGATLTYCAKIDATGTPDTFKWGTNGACDNGATGVAITGANQALSSGVAIKFAATTGHTLADKWSAVATAAATTASLSSTGTPTFNGLKTTGAATGKNVVCVDTSTGTFYASSTGTDCSN